MSKRRWPPISRYDIGKISDEKFKSATNVFSLFTYQIIVLSHQPTTKLHYKPMCKTITLCNNNAHTYHLVAKRYVTPNKYIQKFWKQTIAGDAS